MSFSSIFSSIKKVGSALYGVEHAVAPLVGKIYPPLAIFDSVTTKLHDLIIGAEVSFPAPKSGPLKSAAVVSEFDAGFDIAQELLALDGKALQYDPALRDKAIADQVTAFNSIAAFKSSFHIVPLAAQSGPQPPAGIPGVTVTG